MPDRDEMIATQLVGRGIRDERVIRAMAIVDRERFVTTAQRAHAYDDGPLPIGQRQTISQPYVVALMAEVASISPRDRVLEIGTGSGYATAVLAELAAEVFTIERLPALADGARMRLTGPRYDNVRFAIGDGTRGWPTAAPFDAILAAASSEHAPPSLLAQLAVGGRLVIPLGPSPASQTLVRLTRVSAEAYEQTTFGGVRFVPLVGDEGWRDERAG